MKKVLITGACGNIGATLVKHLQHEYDLLLLDQDPLALEALDRELSADFVLIPFDLWASAPAQYHKLAQLIEEDHQHLDAIIHLAAYCGHLRPVIHTTEEDWLKALQINLTAPLWLTQALLPLLLKAPIARMIFTRFPTHCAKQQAYWHGFGASQAGLDKLIDTLRLEQAAYPSVKIISVAPTWLDSEMSRRIYPNGDCTWQTLESVIPLFKQALTTEIDEDIVQNSPCG